MVIRVLAFAHLRELLGDGRRSVELPAGSCVDDVWRLLARDHPGLAEARGSTRVARNGRLVSFDDGLADGDEIALLPPLGGG